MSRRLLNEGTKSSFLVWRRRKTRAKRITTENFDTFFLVGNKTERGMKLYAKNKQIT